MGSLTDVKNEIESEYGDLIDNGAIRLNLRSEKSLLVQINKDESLLMKIAMALDRKSGVSDDVAKELDKELSAIGTAHGFTRRNHSDSSFNRTFRIETE